MFLHFALTYEEYNGKKYTKNRINFHIFTRISRYYIIYNLLSLSLSVYESGDNLKKKVHIQNETKHKTELVTY